MLCDLLSRCPEEFPRVLYLIENQYGFRYTSWREGYRVQRAIADMLWNRCEDGDDLAFSRLFVAVAGSFLKTHFHYSEPRGGGSVTVYNFDIEPTPELLELRRVLWRGVLRLFRSPRHADLTFGFFSDHHPVGHHGSIEKIITADAEEVLPFFEGHLDPSSLRDCRIVQSYFQVLDWHGVEVGVELRPRFRSPAYQVFELFADRSLIHERGMTSEQVEARTAERIEAYFAGYGLAEYEAFFLLCEEVGRELVRDGQRWTFAYSITRILLAVAEREPSLFREVVGAYLANGNRVGLRHLPAMRLASRLVETAGAEAAREIITASDFPSRHAWLFGYLTVVPTDEIGEQHLRDLYEALEAADPVDLPPSYEFVLGCRR